MLLDGKHEAIQNGLGLAWGFAFFLLGCFSFEGETVSELTLEEAPRLFCCITFYDTSQWLDAQAGGRRPRRQPAPSPSVYHKASQQRLPDTPRNARVPQAPRFCHKKSLFHCACSSTFQKIKYHEHNGRPQNTTPLLSFPQKNENTKFPQCFLYFATYIWNHKCFHAVNSNDQPLSA